MEATLDPAPNPCVEFAIRLADEGIPVRAIARSLKTPSEEIRQTLKDAIAEGTIIAMPRDDWPPGSDRASRAIFRSTPLEDEETLKCALIRVFKATPLEAGFLCMLLRRDQATKEQLHGVVEHNRATPGQEPTDPKMVDVVICKMRKKLKPFGVEIETLWGLGYLISPKYREIAVSKILEAM